MPTNEELIFTIYKQNLDLNGYDERILEVLKRTYPKPLSSFAISLLANIEHTRTCKKLKKLEKFQEIVCMTASRKIKFWRLKKNEK